MKASQTLAGPGVALQQHPHPRVTAVAKKESQPPRRLPSPATERARDLQKGVKQDHSYIFASEKRRDNW